MDGDRRGAFRPAVLPERRIREGVIRPGALPLRISKAGPKVGLRMNAVRNEPQWSGLRRTNFLCTPVDRAYQSLLDKRRVRSAKRIDLPPHARQPEREDDRAGEPRRDHRPLLEQSHPWAQRRARTLREGTNPKKAPPAGPPGVEKVVTTAPRYGLEIPPPLE